MVEFTLPCLLLSTIHVNYGIIFFFCREFKIRLRRDVELFTDDFQAENSEFDPAKVVTGDVESMY